MTEIDPYSKDPQFIAQRKEMKSGFEIKDLNINNLFVDKLRKAASEKDKLLEASRSNGFEKRVTDPPRSDLDRNFPDQYSKSWGDSKISIQFRDPDIGYIYQYTEGESTTNVNAVARIWITEKTAEGKGNAICYILSDSGDWYKKVADTYDFNKEENVRYWNTGQLTKIDTQESELIIRNMLKPIAPQKP